MAWWPEGGFSPCSNEPKIDFDSGLFSRIIQASKVFRSRKQPFFADWEADLIFRKFIAMKLAIPGDIRSAPSVFDDNVVSDGTSLKIILGDHFESTDNRGRLLEC